MISIRHAESEDFEFICSLSPVLAGGAKFGWHSSEVIQKFQDNYISEMLEETDQTHITLVAEKEGVALGFVHAREREDELSGEHCCTIPLLAVAENAQGKGVGKKLMEAVETWSKEQGFRLLHLEVFATNNQAKGFYQELGFEEETLHMIKPLT
ncbi:MAG: N-acetyltransferase family protein [Kordiimonas sp.]